MSTVSAYIPLFRPAIAVFAGAAAATGHLVAAPEPSPRAAVAGLGVFLLACGASAANQVQERDLDRLMERTRHRPLPQGLVTPAQATAMAVLTLAAGVAVLMFFRNPWPAMIGLLAYLWYIDLYIALKTRSAFAAVYGTPVGMAAPAVGWLAAGGRVTDPRLIMLALLLLLWQVAHYWLLLLESGDDFERAGLPTPARIFSRDRFRSLTALWMAATAASSLLLPLFGLVRAPLLYVLLVAAALVPAGAAVRLFREELPAGAAPFRMINGYIAVVMLLVAAEAVLRRS